MNDLSKFLIVGGTSGIGLALTQKLSEGNVVTVWSRNPSDLLSTEVRHERWDAMNGGQTPEIPDVLHGLAYCPGSIRLKPLSRLSDDEFREDFEVNCLGAVKAIRACLPALRRASSASVVLFSTVAVAQGMSMHASVAAAKGGVEGLARSLAAEFAPRIRVNVIAPSLVETPMSKALTADAKRREVAENRHPLQKIGNPEDIATTAADLLTGRLNWITGQTLHLDGGLSSVRILS